MTKTLLAAILSLGFAGAALAMGEGYATTGDWREIKVEPASNAVSAPTLAGSFEFNAGLNGQA